jgi:hypothetical protein
MEDGKSLMVLFMLYVFEGFLGFHQRKIRGAIILERFEDEILMDCKIIGCYKFCL